MMGEGGGCKPRGCGRPHGALGISRGDRAVERSKLLSGGVWQGIATGAGFRDTDGLAIPQGS